jgi:integrase/recombinase XerD
LKIDWRIKNDCDTYDIAVRRYSRFLENQGRRPNTIKSYVKHIKEYIKFCQTPEPSKEKLEEFRDHLFDRHLSRSTINNFSFAIMQYHRMIGEPVKLPILKRNDTLPDFFTEDEVLAIFAAIHNLKHLAMIQTAFYGCLRSSELCNLDDGDVDLSSLRIHIREGKGGRDGITFFNETCARTLRRYLEVRPPLLIDGRQPLFYTDYGHRFDHIEVYRLVTGYKSLAGITKRGGPHSLFRHSTATLMISKGCDIRIVKEVLRHKDLKTTERYCHVTDKTTREWYNKTLRID